MPGGWIAAAIAAAGSVTSAVIGSQGAKSAAETQAQGAQNAANTNLQMFNTITGQEKPWMQGGQAAGSYLDYLLGIPGYENAGGGPQAPIGTYGGQPIGAGGVPGYIQTTGREGPGGPGFFGGHALLEQGTGGRATAGQGGSAASGAPAAGANAGGAPGGFGSLLSPFTIDTFHKMSPAYNFQLQQGEQGVLGQDASNAGALSGAAQKDLMSYNQNAANTAFNNAFNQYQTQQGNIYNRLAGVSQLGQNAAANTGYQGTSLAGNIGAAQYNVGSALAGGTVGATNAITGGINSALPWLMSAFGGNNNSGGLPLGQGVVTGSGADEAGAASSGF